VPSLDFRLLSLKGDVAARLTTDARLLVFKYRSRVQLWDLCNDDSLFYESHNARPNFGFLSNRDNVQGGPDEYPDP
jgi:hypothetical protein